MNFSYFLATNIISGNLTHCGLVKLYGDMDLGQPEHQKLISASLLFDKFMKDVRMGLLQLNIIYEGQ